MHAFIGTKRQKDVVSAWLIGTKPVMVIPIIYTESVAVNDTTEISSTFDSLCSNRNVHSYKYLLVNYF